MNKRIVELLYRSFDSKLTEAEQSELARALAESPELRREKVQIEETREFLRDGAERSFRPFFSARVLNRIKSERRQADFGASLLWAFRRVALAGAFALLLLIANNIFQSSSVSVDALLGLPQLTIEDTWQLQNPLEE